MKLKLAMAYNELIEKLGSRVGQFRELAGLIKMVSVFLNEGAIEVRNVAKRGLFALQNHLGQAELERQLFRSGMNDRQLDKVKQILDKGADYDGTSNLSNSRYGQGSIRGSSLDSRGAPTAYGSNGFGARHSGSDFAKFGQTNEFSM